MEEIGENLTKRLIIIFQRVPVIHDQEVLKDLARETKTFTRLITEG